MRRFIRMFKPEFAVKVRSGEKTQTIRPTPKRMPQPGDIIDCRQWSGKPYRSKQKKIIEGIITSTESVKIEYDGIKVGKEFLSVHQEVEFAKADGFNFPQEMIDWFNHVHGLPFSGTVFRWRLE